MSSDAHKELDRVFRARIGAVLLNSYPDVDLGVPVDMSNNDIANLRKITKESRDGLLHFYCSELDDDGETAGQLARRTLTILEEASAIALGVMRFYRLVKNKAGLESEEYAFELTPVASRNIPGLQLSTIDGVINEEMALQLFFACLHCQATPHSPTSGHRFTIAGGVGVSTFKDAKLPSPIEQMNFVCDSEGVYVQGVVLTDDGPLNFITDPIDVGDLKMAACGLDVRFGCKNLRRV